MKKMKKNKRKRNRKENRRNQRSKRNRKTVNYKWKSRMSRSLREFFRATPSH